MTNGVKSSMALGPENMGFILEAMGGLRCPLYELTIIQVCLESELDLSFLRNLPCARLTESSVRRIANYQSHWTGKY